MQIYVYSVEYLDHETKQVGEHIFDTKMAADGAYTVLQKQGRARSIPKKRPVLTAKDILAFGYPVDYGKQEQNIKSFG